MKASVCPSVVFQALWRLHNFGMRSKRSLKGSKISPKPLNRSLSSIGYVRGSIDFLLGIKSLVRCPAVAQGSAKCEEHNHSLLNMTQFFDSKHSCGILQVRRRVFFVVRSSIPLYLNFVLHFRKKSQQDGRNIFWGQTRFSSIP